jgi:1-acyl-sn-glycerol-3-phosphate acyltransferase
MKAGFLAVATRLLCGANVQSAGFTPGTDPVVFIANHTSHLDALLLWAALPPSLRASTRPVAASDYWLRGPLRRWLANHVFHALLVDRTRVTAHNNPVERFAAALDAGSSLILFPEGTRGTDTEPGPFKAGIFHLAHGRPATCFVPVWIDNLNRILPRGEILPLPLLSRVIFGPSFQWQPDESKPVFLERARRLVLALHEP